MAKEEYEALVIDGHKSFETLIMRLLIGLNLVAVKFAGSPTIDVSLDSVEKTCRYVIRKNTENSSHLILY